MIQVEDNVPLPKIPHADFWAQMPFANLKRKGSSFAVPIEGIELKLTTIQAGIHSRAKRKGIKVETESRLEGDKRVVRVWRIE